MKQKFTTWVGYLLAVATTLMVAMSFASCGREEIYVRNPNQDEIGDKVILQVDNEGPFEVPGVGGEVTVNVTCNAFWSVAVGLTSTSMLEILPENVESTDFEEGFVTVTVKENKSTRPRSGTFSVYTNTESIQLTVNQAGK